MGALKLVFILLANLANLAQHKLQGIKMELDTQSIFLQMVEQLIHNGINSQQLVEQGGLGKLNVALNSLFSLK